MCSDSDNTVLGMDRALFDTMRRIYDSESITEEKTKRAVAGVWACRHCGFARGDGAACQ